MSLPLEDKLSYCKEVEAPNGMEIKIKDVLLNL